MRVSQPTGIAVVLGITQTLAWASTYYLPAMIAAPVAQELGISETAVFAAFSVALLLSAVVGPLAGRAIDAWGGRRVLLGTNILFAAGLVLLAVSNSALGVFAAWAVLGIGMGAGLYEAAFATVVRLHGHGARGSITGVTLLAGFASTIGWPLTAYIDAEHGWRVACFVWAAAHLVLGMPLNALLPTATTAPSATPTADIADGNKGEGGPHGTSAILAFVFAVGWFTSTAMAAHLPQVLVAGGASMRSAIVAGALVGPAQVAARVLEFGLLRRMHPLLSARLACLAHPLGAACLGLVGAAAAPAFAVVHGAGNGILTIAKGTLPLVLFGPTGYGARQGYLMVPARVAQATAPWLFGLLLHRWDLSTLWVTSALGVLAWAALSAIRVRQ